MSGEERDKVLKIRQENKRIADLIMQGTAKHEPVKVLGIDEQEHAIEVIAISDGNFAELLDSTGFNVSDLDNKEKLAGNMKFLQKGAGLVTGVPDIAKALRPMESMKLILKSFELSGLNIPKADSTPSSNPSAENPPHSKSS